MSHCLYNSPLGTNQRLCPVVSNMCAIGIGEVSNDNARLFRTVTMITYESPSVA